MIKNFEIFQNEYHCQQRYPKLNGLHIVIKIKLLQQIKVHNLACQHLMMLLLQQALHFHHVFTSFLLLLILLTNPCVCFSHDRFIERIFEKQHVHSFDVHHDGDLSLPIYVRTTFRLLLFYCCCCCLDNLFMCVSTYFILSIACVMHLLSYHLYRSDVVHHGKRVPSHHRISSFRGSQQPMSIVNYIVDYALCRIEWNTRS